MGGFTDTIGTLNLNSGGTLRQGGALLTLSSAGTALSMQDTTISGNLALTGGGSIAFDRTNNGTALISGNIDLGGNNTVFSIGNGTAPIDMSITGDISNGSLVKNGAGILSLMGSNSVGNVSVNQGVLLINNSLSGGGGINVAAGALLRGTGTISKDTIIHGTLAPGNSIGTISFIGNVTMATASEVEIELNPTLSDLVDVIGAYTIEPGVTLNVIALPGLYSGSPSYTIVQTTEGITGTFSNTVSSSPLFKFTLDYSALDINLNLEQVLFSALFNSGNAGVVAHCLDALMASACSNSTDVIKSLQTIPDEKTLKNALLQIQPSLFTSLAVVQENDLAYLRNALYNRMQMNLRSCCFSTTPPIQRDISAEEKVESDVQMDPAPEVKEKRHTFWVTALGAHTYQKNQDDEPGFVANSPGIFLGLDSKLGKMSCFGGGVAYASTHVHWWEKRGKADVEGIYGTLYGRWASAHAYIQGSLIGGYSFYSVHRNIAFGTTLPFKATANNHHNGWQAVANARIALNYGCRFRFSPFISADYFYVHENSYRESGAQSLNLHVKSKNSDLLSSEIGVDLSHCFGSSRTFSPFVKISAIRESRFQGSKERASLECGCEMTVSGLYPSRTLAGVAGGFNANMQNATLSLFYQGKYASSYSDNSWYLEYGLKF